MRDRLCCDVAEFITLVTCWVQVLEVIATLKIFFQFHSLMFTLHDVTYRNAYRRQFPFKRVNNLRITIDTTRDSMSRHVVWRHSTWSGTDRTTPPSLPSSLLWTRFNTFIAYWFFSGDFSSLVLVLVEGVIWETDGENVGKLKML